MCDNNNTEGTSTSNPTLEIQHGSNDMLLLGFRVEPLLLPTGDDFKEKIYPEYDPHGNVNVIHMFINMHFMPELGEDKDSKGYLIPLN